MWEQSSVKKGIAFFENFAKYITTSLQERAEIRKSDTEVTGEKGNLRKSSKTSPGYRKVLLS